MNNKRFDGAAIHRKHWDERHRKRRHKGVEDGRRGDTRPKDELCRLFCTSPLEPRYRCIASPMSKENHTEHRAAVEKREELVEYWDRRRLRPYCWHRRRRCGHMWQ